MAWEFQQRFRKFWEENLPEKEAALLLGVTMGGRGRLSRELKNACIRAGVYHIMVVSGQNVALLISLVIGLLRLFRVPARHALWVCAGPAIFYAVVVGADRG